MCNAYNLRHRNEAILDIARAMQLAVADLPEFPPQHRIGIKQRGLILRPVENGTLAWSWARWSLTPLGSMDQRPYPLNNARADKLGAWPWPPVQRQRCLTPATGFWEPEKLAREKGVAPWSYYSMTDGRPFFMAGLWAEASDPATGEVADKGLIQQKGQARAGALHPVPDDRRGGSDVGGVDHHPSLGLALVNPSFNAWHLSRFLTIVIASAIARTGRDGLWQRSISSRVPRTTDRAACSGCS